MVSETSRSDVSAPNSGHEPISDDDLIRGFVLALGAETLRGERQVGLDDAKRSPLHR